MNRVILFGGSFDPIHNGHLAIAGSALLETNSMEVIFAPTGSHPFNKNSLKTEFNKRCKIVNLAIAPYPPFTLWTKEGETDKISYTIDTIYEIKKARPQCELLLLIGGDNLKEFHKWKDWQKIVKESTLLVASRPESNISIPDQLSQERVIILKNSPHWSVSSSLIRSHFSQNIQMPGLTPPAVEEYCLKNKLYQKENL